MSEIPPPVVRPVESLAAHAKTVLDGGEVTKVAAGFLSKIPSPLSPFLKTVHQKGPTEALNQKVGARTVTAVKAIFEAFQALVIASSNFLLLSRVVFGNDIHGVGAAVMSRVAMWYFGWLPTLAFHTAAIVASKALPESVNSVAARAYNWSADTVGTGVEFVADKVRKSIIQLAN